MKMPVLTATVVVMTAVAFAVPPASEGDAKAVITPDDAAKRTTVPEGLTVSVWAAEPLMANPVAFCFDEKGFCYVAETTRFEKGVPDTRGHMYWLDDDIACRTVEDRLAMYRKHKFGDFTKYDDQIRKVWDSAGKGAADKSSIFASGFNTPADGLIAGVLARKGSVYAACIPSLYKFDDFQNHGVDKQALSTGYGVRVQYLGHDLHGLRIGPDGRLYFSIGDRGFNVVNKEGKRLSNPDSGAVLRCELDGSQLEIVHVGLRNPQELAFDDYGNLFTYDNNCDSGDKARWVHIVPGGDSGWRCGYQYGTYYHTPAVKQGNRGPWNTEGIWHLASDELPPPAYVLPPLAHFGAGPAGITHYPGVGLNDKYKDHFFACDFTSNPQTSTIWSLAVKPKGASFEVVDLQPFVRNMVPTDCEFGPDGAFYWSDWVSGWNPQDRGRIFKVTDPEAMKNPAVKEAKELLAAGMETKSLEELLQLLGHPHQQVRFESQYELANPKRHSEKLPRDINSFLKSSKNEVARRHAIWALGQISRREKREAFWLIEFLRDSDAAIRGNAAIAVAEAGSESSLAAIVEMLKDKSVTVRYQAAMAIAIIAQTAMISTRDTMTELLQMGRDAGADPAFRHAAVHALSMFPANDLRDFNYGPIAKTTEEKRMLCMAIRRCSSEKNASHFKTLIDDTDAVVMSEAARAIYDDRIISAMPMLAAMTAKSKLNDAILFRALAANYLIGDVSGANRLTEIAANKTLSDYLRATALKLLADWPKPPRRDPITGCTIDLPPRDPEIVRTALRPFLNDIFSGSDIVRKEAVACVRKLEMTDVGEVLAKLVRDDKLPADTRVDALFALADLKAKELGEVLPIAAMASEPKLKAAVRVVRVKSNPKVVEEFPGILDEAKTSIIEKQMILASLGTLPDSVAADKLLGDWLERLIRGEVPAELKLEILESSQQRAEIKKPNYDFKTKLKEYDTAVRKAAGDKLDKRYPEALAGGDAAKGRAIFLNNAAVYCQRCHKLDNEGGEVGPPLNGLGTAKTREYLLESIVVPNAQIAEGYKSVILELVDGRKVSGVLRAKTKDKYTLKTPEDKTLEIPAADVESEKPDKSAMPDDLHKKLSKRELRDLVEFLVGLKK